MYKNFAYIYDQLMDEVDYENWFNYIEGIFKKYGKSPERILEMACGTGNLSYYLAKADYDLTCFDLSDDMLSIAYNKLGKFKRVKLLKQNMIDFQLGEKFQAIISICDSINYILDEEDLLQTFKKVKEHLEEDGIFIFDINSHYKLSQIIANNTFIEDREDIYYIWQNYFDQEENLAEFYLTFFTKEGEKYRRFDEEHLERAYYQEEIIDLLGRAGFKDLASYDGLSIEEARDKSERITFVALA